MRRPLFKFRILVDLELRGWGLGLMGSSLFVIRKLKNLEFQGRDLGFMERL